MGYRMRSNLIGFAWALLAIGTAEPILADEFGDLVRQVDHVMSEPTAGGWDDPILAGQVSDEAIAHRKKMVIRAAGDDRFRSKAANPKLQFPIVLARLMLNPDDREALAYVPLGMRYRGKGDTFGKSSLSRLFCQFGSLLESGVVEALRDELTTYPGFLGGGTENHVAMRRTAGYLAAERFPEATFYHGLSGEKLAHECREFIRTYGRTVYANSMFEYLSPIYHAVDTAPWLNVAEFARDDGTRLMARAILDWMMADYALNYHQGVVLPPFQREKGLLTGSYQLSYARSLSQWTGWLYWGGGNTPQQDERFGDPKYLPNQPYGLGAVLHAVSSWNPHPVIRNIGAKRLPGPYRLLQSRVNWQLIEQTHLNEYGKTTLARPGQPNSRYNMRSVYVDRDYAIGASYRHENIMDPYLRSAVPFSVAWQSEDDCNWLLPAHPYWFTLRKWEDSEDVLGNEDWSGINPFLQMVHWENAAILVWDIPQRDPYEGRFGKGSPKFPSERRLDLIQCAYVYVPATIDERQESPAGFFLREGDVYIAIRPLSDGAHWETSRHAGFVRLAMPGPLVGFAIEVGDKSEFGSFEAFQDKTSTGSLDLSAFQTEKRATYRSTRGHVLSLRHRSPNWLPDASVDGVALDFARWPIWESPYATCRDRVLDVNDGRQGFTIDWRGDWPEYTYYEVHGSNRKVTGREWIQEGKLQSRPSESDQR